MSRVVIWSFLVVSLVLLSIPATSLADETVCLQCHAGLSGHLSAPVADWKTSVHAENGISCHDCHGGDPTDMAMAMSQAACRELIRYPPLQRRRTSSP